MDPNKETQEAASPPDPTLQAETPQAETQPQPEPSPEEAALAAMDKGIEEASEAEEPVVVDGEEPKAEEPAPEAAKPEEASPDDRPNEIEAEIKDLNLKEKAASRFRELTGRVEELSTALKAAGIEDIKALPELVERAKYGEELVSRVIDTGANADQFNQALGYLQLVNAAGGGDVKAAEAAFDIMQGELQALGKFLGRDVPGIVDPLADHPDLIDDLEAGDITRARALEIAKTRNQGKIAETVRTREADTATQTRAQQDAVEQGRSDIIQWDSEMKANDPTYAAKRPILEPIVAEIRATKPPSEWLRLTTLAYARIPTPKPAEAPKPTPGPVRGNRGTSGMVPDVSKMTMAQALDAAIGP